MRFTSQARPFSSGTIPLCRKPTESKMVITLTILPVGLPANLTSPRMISASNHARTKGGQAQKSVHSQRSDARAE